MKLSVYIEGSSKTISLDKSLVVKKGSTLVVKSVSIFWDFKNVYKGQNDIIQYGGNKHTIPEGYWSFDDLAERFTTDKSLDITLKKNRYDSTCTLKTVQPMKLYKFGELLGFESNTLLALNTTTISPNKVNICNDLRFVGVHCDTLVDGSIDSDGKRSSVIAVCPITTEATANDVVTHYPNVNSRVGIRSGTYNNLSFHVKSNTNVTNIGSVLLDLYIEE